MVKKAENKGVSVTQFATEIGVKPQRLLEQFKDAGTKFSSVDDIVSEEQKQKLLRYLKQLPPVQQIQLKQINGNVVELSILIHGPMSTFQQNAAINQKLQFKSQDDATNKLIYDWVH